MRIKRRNDERTNRDHDKEVRITIPKSSKADVISRELEKTNIQVATKTGIKIQEIAKTTSSDKNKNKEKSVVYEIPCKGCGKKLRR